MTPQTTASGPPFRDLLSSRGWRKRVSEGQRTARSAAGLELNPSFVVTGQNVSGRTRSRRRSGCRAWSEDRRAQTPVPPPLRSCATRQSWNPACLHIFESAPYLQRDVATETPADSQCVRGPVHTAATGSFGRHNGEPLVEDHVRVILCLDPLQPRIVAPKQLPHLVSAADHIRLCRSAQQRFQSGPHDIR